MKLWRLVMAFLYDWFNQDIPPSDDWQMTVFLVTAAWTEREWST